MRANRELCETEMGKTGKTLANMFTMLAIIFVVSEDATRRRVRDGGESAGSK